MKKYPAGMHAVHVQMYQYFQFNSFDIHKTFSCNKMGIGMGMESIQ